MVFNLKFPFHPIKLMERNERDVENPKYIDRLYHLSFAKVCLRKIFAKNSFCVGILSVCTLCFCLQTYSGLTLWYIIQIPRCFLWITERRSRRLFLAALHFVGFVIITKEVFAAIPQQLCKHWLVIELNCIVIELIVRRSYFGYSK